MSTSVNRTNSEPARAAEAVTLGSDWTPGAPLGSSARALWIGTGGDGTAVKVDMLEGGTAITFNNVPSGSWLEVSVTKVYSTANGTTASDIVAVK